MLFTGKIKWVGKFQKHRVNHPRVLRRLFGVIITGIIVAFTTTSITASAATIAQGYTTTHTFPPGTLVATKNNQSNEVIAANTENSEATVGVIINGNDSTLTVNSETSTQVATSGTATVFVTDLAGAIKAGDKITASPLSGVGMKATGNIKIVGTAEKDFDNTRAIKQQTVKARDGTTQKVQVGSIPIQVQVMYYSAPQSDSVLPTFLQQFSNVVAGKQISALRVLVGFFIILVGVLIASIMVFSAVKSSILSIGRNPLASKSIYKNLLRVFVMSALILAVTVGGTYVIMRL